ncbi:hypothetical protein D3C81_1538720 [compost metagenome]
MSAGFAPMQRKRDAGTGVARVNDEVVLLQRCWCNIRFEDILCAEVECFLKALIVAAHAKHIDQMTVFRQQERMEKTQNSWPDDGDCQNLISPPFKNTDNGVQGNGKRFC